MNCAKGRRIGPGEPDDKTGRVLKRVVRWTTHGLEYEADPRQSERLIESQGLDGSSNNVVTTGLKPTKEQMEAESPLEAKLQTPYRADGARSKYIGPADQTSTMQRRRYADGCRLRLMSGSQHRSALCDFFLGMSA